MCKVLSLESLNFGLTLLRSKSKESESMFTNNQYNGKEVYRIVGIVTFL